MRKDSNQNDQRPSAPLLNKFKSSAPDPINTRNLPESNRATPKRKHVSTDDSTGCHSRHRIITESLL